MEESNEQPVEKMESECNVTNTKNDEEPNADESAINLDSLKQINCQKGVDKNSVEDEFQNSLSPLKTKESSTGTKVKRKSRSTRRRLNAMINNTSLHFSDTDSEGELTTVPSHVRAASPAKSLSLPVQQGPVISVTLDDSEIEIKPSESLNCLSPDDKVSIPRSSSFIDNLTDIDEIYPSEPEYDQKDSRNSLTIADSPCQAETDFEDFEGDEDVQPIIYVKPRSDLFCDSVGETITTKEGDGPFSVEVRNKIYFEENPRNATRNDTPDIIIAPNTDEEDMDVSGDEDLEEACCSQKELYEDLDVLAASQIVMKNISKIENSLAVKHPSDDASSDCHTDVEDVD